MFGLFLQTIFNEVAHGIPFVIRQEPHISLPLCQIFPDLYGCDPGIGALTSLKIWEFSQHIGQISAMLVNLFLISIISMWITFRLQSEGTLPGILTGISGVFSSLILALAFNVPINAHFPWGIFGIAMFLLLPLSGWMGGRIGTDRIAKQLSHRGVLFIPGDDAIQLDWSGESLSKRELEVLTLVAEGL